MLSLFRLIRIYLGHLFPVKIKFQKYQGTGNDFVMIDDRNEKFDIDAQSLIKKLCDRKFGIGADGLILLRNHKEMDFEMIYFNSDGNQSSMCGNGGRCITNFASTKEVFENRCNFMAIDGEHTAEISDGNVALGMNDVGEIEVGDDYFYMNSGSPHYVMFRDNIKEIDVNVEAHQIRYSDRFKNDGTNVNFVEESDGGIQVRTYERGVEGETLSCGTGVIACAIASAIKQQKAGDLIVEVETLGGNLNVHFKLENNTVKNVELVGAATFVFSGETKI